MKRIISLLLIVITISLLFSSCVDNKNNNQIKETTETAEKTKDKPNQNQRKYLDEVNTTFKYQTLGIVLDQNEKTKDDFTRDAYNKEILNDAIVARNTKVQEKVKVRLKWYPVEDSVDEIQRAVMNNLQYYSIHMGDSISSYAVAITSGGLFVNLMNSEKNKYIDISKPYWSSYIADTATVYDKLFCITGAPSLSLYKNAFAMYFSKSVLSDLGRTQEDLFGIIADGIDSNGGWTFDTMLNYIKGVGNGIDLFGLTMDNSYTLDPFWSAFDLTLLKRTTDGGIEFTSDITKFNDAIENLLKPLINNNKKDVKVYNSREENGGISPNGDEIADTFSNNQSLFAIITLNDASRENIKNMDKGKDEDGYGLIPLPKYDEYQKNYYSYIGDKYVVFAIPKNVENVDMATATLEVFASISYVDVAPKYYDTILKGQYMSDPYSAEMLDLITDNIKIDPAWIFTFAFTGAASKVAQEGFREIINGYGKRATFMQYWNSIRTAKDTALHNSSNTGILDKYKAIVY